ncbi:MAG: hypothetical protein ACYCQI_14375 [Gammaproteobacteria bacterium]
MQLRTTTSDLTQRLSLDESKYADKSKDLKEKDEKKSAHAAKESEKNSETTSYEITELMIEHICTLSVNPEEKELADMIEYLKSIQDQFVAECKDHPTLAKLRYDNIEGFKKDAAKKLTEPKYKFSVSMTKLIETLDNINKQLKPIVDKNMEQIIAREKAARALLQSQQPKDLRDRENNSYHQPILKDYFKNKDYNSVLNYIQGMMPEMNISLCTYISFELHIAQEAEQSVENTMLLVEIASVIEKAESALRQRPRGEESKERDKVAHKEKKDDWVVVKPAPAKPALAINPYAPPRAPVEDPLEQMLRISKEEAQLAADIEKALKMSMM